MENQQEAPKEAKKQAFWYLCRYDTPKPQILRAKGHERILRIYLSMGFVEISQEEYERILALKRAELE